MFLKYKRTIQVNEISSIFLNTYNFKNKNILMVGLEWRSIEYLKIARCHKIGLELGLRQSLSFKPNCRP